MSEKTTKPGAGGPKTNTGKKRSSKNAIKHGLTATTTILKHECQTDLDAVRAGLRAALCPVGHLEDLVAERIVQHAWRLRRFARVETATIQHAMEDDQFDFLTNCHGMTDDMTVGRGLGRSAALENISRYEKTAETAFYRSLKEFWEIQERRVESGPVLH